MTTQVLDIKHIDEILEFERANIDSSTEQMEKEFIEWHASWRRESLEHYLPLGWSFGIWQDAKLSGYFLAQPLLFARGLTQTLWVEWMSGNSSTVSADLVDIAYRVAREKHFQTVLFNAAAARDFSQFVLQLQPIHDAIMEIKTSKF